jgi:hypothetical protein
MVPLYTVRVQDLGQDDFVQVECIACGHDEMVRRSADAGFTPAAADVASTLNRACGVAKCDAKGKACDGEVGGLADRRVSVLWPGLSRETAHQRPIYPGMGRRNDWIADWVGDWNKWSSTERVLALLIVSLLLALPLSLLLASR